MRLFALEDTTFALIAVVMNNHYVACDLGAESGRIVLGTLRDDGLSLGEAHHFPNTPVEEDGRILLEISKHKSSLPALLSSLSD